MTQTSKYNIGDKCWYQYLGKIYECIVIDIVYWDSSAGWFYKVKHNDTVGTYEESELHSSVEELIKTIIRPLDE